MKRMPQCSPGHSALAYSFFPPFGGPCPAAGFGADYERAEDVSGQLAVIICYMSRGNAPLDREDDHFWIARSTPRERNFLRVDPGRARPSPASTCSDRRRLCFEAKREDKRQNSPRPSFFVRRRQSESHSASTIRVELPTRKVRV